MKDEAMGGPSPAPGRTMRLIVFGGAWAAFIAYAVVAAPPDDPALTRALIHGTLTGDFGVVDPSIAAAFSALGVIPVLATALLARDAATSRVPAWPFAIGMFAVGAFALLPYLALRDVAARPRGPAGPLRRLLASRTLAWLIVLTLTLLAAWAIRSGSAAAYAYAFHHTAMVHVMSIDAVVCTVAVHYLMERDRSAFARATPQRGTLEESTTARRVRALPLFGPALWNALVRRAP